MASLKKCYAKSRPLFIFITIVMLLSTSSFCTSPTSFVMGREVLENTASSTEIKEEVGISMKKLYCKKKKEGRPCPSSLEESAREVPTGPDPLHHNDKPIRP